MLFAKAHTFTFYLLIALLAIMTAQLTWKVINLSAKSDATNLVPTPQISNSATQNNLSALVSSIAANQLFGISNQPLKAKPTKTVSNKALKKTALSLKLAGLIQGKQSVAVIIYQGKQGAYALGDYIVNNNRLKVSLVSVMRNYVIIENNGVQERLNLPKSISKAPSQVGIATKNSNNANAAINLDFNSQAIKAIIGSDPKKIIITNPLSLSKFIQLSPSMVKGNLKGYQINAGPNKRLLQATGIKPGDIITHIDGQAAGSLTVPSMYQSLQVKDTISISVDRNGSIITMDIKL